MKKALGILIGCLLLGSMAHAQYGHDDLSIYLNPLIEEKKIEDPIARDSALIWRYNYIAEELARTSDHRTQLYLDTLKNYADKSTWPSAQAFYNRAMGRYHDFRGEFTPALDYYTKAIDVYKVANGRKQEIAFAHVLKGFLLSNAELYDEARIVMNEGLPYAKQAKGKNSLCFILDWFGDIHYYGLEGEKNNEKALEYYLQVNEILPQISYSRIIADNYAVLSGIYDRIGKTEKAESHFQIADSLSEKFNLPYVRWGLYAEKARVLEENGNHLAANKVYLKTKEFFEGSTDIRFKSRLEKALWENYKNIGDYKNALIHHEQLIEMNKTMDVTSLEEKYAEIEAKYEVAIKENEVAQLQKEKSKINRNFLLGLLGLTIVGGVIIFSKNRALAKSYVALEKKQAEVEQAIYQGETQERQRVAADLHDNVNTKLAAARWQLEAVNEEIAEPAKTVIDMTINLMNEAYHDVRNISHNLVPTHLEEKGLVESIQNLLQKLNNSNNIQFGFKTQDVVESSLKKIAYPIYNIVFELINNVMKHADATTSDILMTSSKDKFIIEVKDNGRGYEVDKMKKGFGLRSIQSRVEALNGTIDLSSEIGVGTTTEITIPLP